MPLAHRQGGDGDGGGLFAGELAPDQISGDRTRSARSSRCWKTTGVLKIGQN